MASKKRKTPSKKAPPQNDTRVFSSGAILLGVASLAFILIIFIISSGGIGGFINNLRPLPDFEGGKAYAQRDAYRAEVAGLNSKLESMTETGSSFPYIDTCERSVNDWKRRGGYYASCRRNVERLYFSNEEPCALLEKVKGAQNFEYTSGCDGEVPAKRPSVALYSDPAFGYVRIEIATQAEMLKSLQPFFTHNAFSGDACLNLPFCQYYEGDYPNWPALVESNTYPTVMRLESNNFYFTK